MDYKHIKSQAGTDVREILIHGIIGRDINGLEVANELRFLIDFEDVKEINMRINSSGGSMVEGFGIISAMHHAFKKGVIINTINDGLSASMGALIFVNGTHRKMHDFSLLMFHNPNLGNQAITDDQKPMIEKFRNSAVTIIKNKTGLSESKTGKMLDNETWIEAIEGNKMLGVFDEIIVTKNKKKKAHALSLIESGATALDVMNVYKGKSNKIKMEKVYNHLGISDASTPEAVVKAIESVVSAITAKKEAVATELATVKSEITTKDARIAELEGEAKVSHTAKVEAVVNKAIIDKKIKAEAKDSFIAIGEDSIENLNTVLNAITVPEVQKPNLLKTVQNGVILPSGEKPKSLREMEREDPKGLTKIKNENPELYGQMYVAEYGVPYAC